MAAGVDVLRPVRVVPRLTVAGLGFAAIAIVLLYQTLGYLDRPPIAVIWGGLALTAYCAALLCLVGSVHYGDLGIARWKMGPWMLLWYGAAFGICTITLSQPQSGTPAEIALPNVLKALWLIALGLTTWTVGYLIGPGQPGRRLARRAIAWLGKWFSEDVRSPLAPWILCAIGTAATLILSATTGVFGYVGDASSLVNSATNYSGILGVLSLAGPLAVSAGALQVFRERSHGARFTLIILLLAEVGLGAAQGNKQTFVLAVLAVMIPFSAARRKLPKFGVIVSILAFLFVIIPFTQAYRGADRNGLVTLSTNQALSEAPSIFEQTVVNESALAVLPQSLDYFMQRIRQIDSTAIIIQRTPEQISFLNPVQLVEGPVGGVIPRSIWANKPINLTGYQFSQDYFELPSTVYSSTAETTIGGLYRYGGWLPVIAGMFLIGCGMRMLDNVLDVRTNAHAIFLLLLLFPSLVEGQEDWQSILAFIPATVVTWLITTAVTFRLRRSA
jgi:hypothetical protein